MAAANYPSRLRVFAGPNGSGKSTIIESIRKYKIAGRPIDFGVYINADDIARALETKVVSFSSYQLKAPSRSEFIKLALETGLIQKPFDEETFKSSFSLGQNGQLKLRSQEWSEHLAQVVSAVLREMLLAAGKKFSFETVFSHPSKIDFMRRASVLGYKVYLYFICTESPDINIARIKEVRVRLGGHDVPEDKVRARYNRSLDLMFDAAELACQAYFFDNSTDALGNSAEYFAHFKIVKRKKDWDIDGHRVPQWFYSHYLNKV